MATGPNGQAIASRCRAVAELCDLTCDLLWTLRLVIGAVEGDAPNLRLSDDRRKARRVLKSFQAAFRRLHDLQDGQAWLAVACVEVNPEVVSLGDEHGRSYVEIAYVLVRQRLAGLLLGCFGTEAAIDLGLEGPQAVPFVRLGTLVKNITKVREVLSTVPDLNKSPLSLHVEKECERAIAILETGTILWRETAEGASKKYQAVNRFRGTCPLCESPAKVSSTRTSIRKLKCKNPECSHCWKAAKDE